MRYLVTGGLGVVGSTIVRHLLAAGHDVNVIDSCDEPRNHWIHDELFKLDTTLKMLGVYKQRLEHADNLQGRVEEVDAVIHCAASTGIPYSVDRPSDDWERNVDGTRKLLEALRRNPRPTVVLSSVKPYRVPDDIVDRGGLREDDVLEPDEPYAASKAAQSLLCRAYARSYGVPVVVFRCSNLYGSAPCHGPRHGWLTWFCVSAAIGRPIEVQGTGTQTRDMLHADDVYRACMMALDKNGGLKGEVFNLGGGFGNRISVVGAANELHELTGVDVWQAPARAMDDRHVFANTTKFFQATGWTPQVHVKGGLLSTLAWAQVNKAMLAELYKDVP